MLKRLIKFTCVALIVTITVSFASCGTKKQKMREALTESVTKNEAINESISNTAALSENPAKTSITINSKNVSVKYVQSFELREYKGNFNTAIDEQQVLAKNHLKDFQKLVLYLSTFYSKNLKEGDELNCIRVRNSDGSYKYTCNSDKKIDKDRIKAFFDKYDEIDAVRYYKISSVETAVFEFAVPKSITTLDYSAKMKLTYNSSGSTSGIDEMDNVYEFRFIDKTQGWFYYVEKDLSEKIRIKY